jgi:glycosyltransferase involved in cell wall biosynthesis
MKKVLHVIPSISKSHGGPSKAIKLFEEVICLNGWDFNLATTNDGIDVKALIKQQPSNLRYFFFSLNANPYKISIEFLFWARKNIKNYDVVHIHSLFSFTSVVAALISRFYKIPYIIRPLGVLNEYGMNGRRPILKKISFSLIEKNILENASMIHFTSIAEKKEAKKLKTVFKSTIIPLAIDTFNEFYTINETQYTQNKTLNVLFLSRLDEKKNIESLFYGLNTLKSRGVKVFLTIAGSGSTKYLSALKSLEKQLGISDLIEWIGFVEGDAKIKAFKKADVFILPSFSENFGIAVLESLAFGLPCIVGEGVAISSEIQKYNAGIVIKPDEQSIVDAITYFILNEDSIPTFSRNARKLAEEEYSMEKMGKRIMLLYNSILNEKN